jgi:O-acetyl-ADP-ribose deacetylase (regulator of RNase III)
MSLRANPGIEVVLGDLTKVEADAIVNAANSALAEGGGVCGAIFRAAGREVLTVVCRATGGCATGSAVITPAFGIKTARYIVHAVGPVYASYPEDDARRLLRSAYASAIEIAQQNGCTSIAFPAISTGIYGYPLEEACKVAAEVCQKGADAGMRIQLVAFDPRTAECLRRAIGSLSAAP